MQLDCGDGLVLLLWFRRQHIETLLLIAIVKSENRHFKASSIVVFGNPEICYLCVCVFNSIRKTSVFT